MPESPLDLELGESVRQRFGLRQAAVLTAQDVPPDFNRQELGALASSVLAEMVDEDSIVGIAWGRTLDKMAAALPPLSRCTVVQIIGGVSGVGISLNSHDVVRRVAARSRGLVYAFHAPLIAPDASTARSRKRDPEVARSLEQFERLTCAVVAIGSWEPMDSMMAQSFEPDPAAHRQARCDRGHRSLAHRSRRPLRPFPGRRPAPGHQRGAVASCAGGHRGSRRRGEDRGHPRGAARWLGQHPHHRRRHGQGALQLAARGLVVVENRVGSRAHRRRGHAEQLQGHRAAWPERMSARGPRRTRDHAAWPDLGLAAVSIGDDTYTCHHVLELEDRVMMADGRGRDRPDERVEFRAWI
jgi:hypothetical protein